MKIIEGGVCAAKGFKAGSVRCGVKESRTNDDTAIIFSECECTAAATYTMNRVKAAPLYVTMEHLENGVARAIVANAGNANACAPDGMENARRMAKAAAQLLGVAETDVAVASTGVIGQRLNIECIEEHLPELKLEDNASEKANRAIMTTDTKPKTAAVEFTISGKTCRIGGICKGSGMIHPNMGTMLSFITTDCAITHEMLTDALQENVKKTYNRVTVDGDTSTNDMCIVLANGMAGNTLIEWQDEEYQAFCKAMNEVNARLLQTAKAQPSWLPAPLRTPAPRRQLSDWPRPLSAPISSRRLCSVQMQTGDVYCVQWATPRHRSVRSTFLWRSSPQQAA